MYGYICPFCGDHLDPGEKCDCREKEQETEETLSGLLSTDLDGQMMIKETAASA